MSKPRVLFVTHRPKQCGVFEFGKHLYQAIASSAKYEVIHTSSDSLEELNGSITRYSPVAVIYNYHPSVLPWVSTKITKGLYRNNLSGFKPIQIGIIHEVTQKLADTATGYRNKWIVGPSQRKLNSLFDYYIAADPTLLLKNPLVFKTGRLIPEYNKPRIDPSITTIGSYGFATPKKGFENLVAKVQEEFDEARIRLNMPSADFGDEKGEKARMIAAECRKILVKTRIRLDITHDYMSDEELLDFLAANSINVFMYEDKSGRGLSSAVDNALAVKKPIAVSECPMFRHILVAQPSVSLEDSSIKQILENGFDPLEKISKDWDKEHIRWEYERILDSIMQRENNPQALKMGLKRKAQSYLRRLFTLPDKSFTWLRNTESETEDDLQSIRNSIYLPVKIPPGTGFNRILDEKARRLYKSAIDKLFELVPKTMAKKIPQANVQQGFVFDTVYRHITHYPKGKILCVGSYEDTASMALRKMGFYIEEVDPMINYYLQEFYTKPSTRKNSYSIIFSTSVIEHEPDDESFIRCIAGLLAPGGLAILTCDYKERWKPEDPKPDVDARLYTKDDLERRLPSYIPDCQLVDEPTWECPHPDFNYLGKYQYSFASFVIRKKL